MLMIDKENYVLPTHCTLLLKMRRGSVYRLSAQRRLAGHDRKGLWTLQFTLAAKVSLEENEDSVYSTGNSLDGEVK